MLWRGAVSGCDEARFQRIVAGPSLPLIGNDTRDAKADERCLVSKVKTAYTRPV